MFSGEGNDNGENTTIGLIGKKATLQVQHTFCTFLCRCFARLQRETSRNFLVTCFMKDITYVFLFTFFHCCSFSPWWPVAFLIFSPPLQTFHVVLPKKKCILCFVLTLGLCRSQFPFTIPSVTFGIAVWGEHDRMSRQDDFDALERLHCRAARFI